MGPEWRAAAIGQAGLRGSLACLEAPRAKN